MQARWALRQLSLPTHLHPPAPRTEEGRGGLSPWETPQACSRSAPYSTPRAQRRSLAAKRRLRRSLVRRVRSSEDSYRHRVTIFSTAETHSSPTTQTP